MKSIPILIVAFLLFEFFRFIKYYKVTKEFQKSSNYKYRHLLLLLQQFLILDILSISKP
jgi:hypothetical protein